MFHTYLNIYQPETEPLTMAITDGQAYGLFSVGSFAKGDWTVIAELEDEREWLTITWQHDDSEMDFEQPADVLETFYPTSQTQGVQFVFGKTGVRLENTEPSPTIAFHIYGKKNKQGECIYLRIAR